LIEKGRNAMKQYDEVFKKEAVKMSEEIGMRKTGENLGIPYYTLKDWRRKILGASGKIRKREKQEMSEVEKLREESKELKKSIEILRGALSFFVTEQKK
jgi:transposase